MKRSLALAFIVLQFLTSSCLNAALAQSGAAPNTTLYDGMYTNDYLDHGWSFNDNALGNIGNLTIMNRQDHAVNVTLIGLEGFVIISSQNRTILAIIGVIVEVNDGVVSYLPQTWVVLDPVGGEKSNATLVVWGFCIGPYDVHPDAGELDVQMPTPVSTPDSFQTTRDIVEYSNTLDYPGSYSQLDTLLARSVLFFALTGQDVSPEELQEIYPRYDIDAIVKFIGDALKELGIDVEQIPMITGKEEPTQQQPTSNPPLGIPGFPLHAIALSIFIMVGVTQYKHIRK